MAFKEIAFRSGLKKAGTLSLSECGVAEGV